jgi:hypothetical protein
MIQLFSHPVYRRYLARRCSLAYLFSWLCSIFVIIVPFFLCFSPEHMRGESTEGGLWIKNKSYREQPQLHFRKELILVVQAMETVIVNSTMHERITRPKEIFFSTSSVWNELYPSSFRIASIKSREIDTNFDDIVDSMNIQVLMPLLPGENVYSIQMIPFFDFSLSRHVKIQMDTLAYIHYASGIPITSLVTKGDLKLKQRALFSIQKSPSMLFPNDPLFYSTPPSRGPAGHSSTIQQVLETADSRLFSTDYLERYASSKRGDYATTGYDSSLPISSLNITLTLHNTAQSIDYTPALYELFTDAWIRYFSLYWIAIKLVGQLYSFVYSNQLIGTFEKIDRVHTHWSKKHN